ncbi:MAG: T9SS type A sorting domain-containing protein [Bacteroidetes bacterium]|nr:T9SS type A sorting domain-containing protein [Bacteroidota bacterium]MBL0020355.1 T9SS type A sorting domain-containing protein [Bacteroidota bacterium]MBP8073266.1 T9SS type A sorting domain-containing protein [Bacteroidia bacterium]
MKRKLQILCLLLLAIQGMKAQVPKKVLVEHFSNTNCSICANRNPAFYANYNMQSNALHLAIHPSAPYPNCLLSQQSSPQNDARTNHYGIYGGTPRLVINGTVISTGANYGASSIFTPFVGQTSPASIRIVQEKFGMDSIVALISVKTEAVHTLGNLVLFVALSEDTVNYTGGNGETAHFDVFRKALTDATGTPFTLPATVGDSMVFRVSSAADPIWDFSRIYTMAVVQEAGNKVLVQAAAAAPGENGSTTGVTSGLGQIEVYPNPTENLVHVRLPNASSCEITILNHLGQTVARQKHATQSFDINLSTLPSAKYWLQVRTPNGSLTKPIVKL